MRLIVANMLNWAADELRPELVNHLAYVRRNGPYPQLQTTLPQTPIRSTILKTHHYKSARAAGNRDMTKETPHIHGVKKAPPSIAKTIRRLTSRPIHPRLEALNLSEPEEESSLDSESEDSGIGGMSDHNANETDLEENDTDTDSDNGNDANDDSDTDTNDGGDTNSDTNHNDDDTDIDSDDGKAQRPPNIILDANNTPRTIDRIVDHRRELRPGGTNLMLQFLVVYKGSRKPRSRWWFKATLTKRGYGRFMDEYWDEYWESIG